MFDYTGLETIEDLARMFDLSVDDVHRMVEIICGEMGLHHDDDYDMIMVELVCQLEDL